jgi:hypothetical protein
MGQAVEQNIVPAAHGFEALETFAIRAVSIAFGDRTWKPSRRER